MSKSLSKYNASFNYVDKALFVLLATSGGFSDALFATVFGALVGITSAYLALTFLWSNEIGMKSLKTMTKKKEKCNKVVLFARIEVNTTENIISKALTDNEISQEEFTISMNEAEIIVN